MQFFRYLAVVIFTFPWEWMTTRDPKFFLAGFPAIASLVGIGVVIGYTGTQDQSDMLPRYLNSAQKAYLNEDYEAAEVLYRKAASLDPEKPEPKYGMAKTAEKQGHLGRAWRLMDAIAPLQRPGYVKAHFWIAENLMKNYGELGIELRKLNLETRVLAARQAEGQPGENDGQLKQSLQEKQLKLVEIEEQFTTTAEALKQHLEYTVQQQQKNIIAHAYLAQIYLDEIPTAKTKEDSQQLIEKAKSHLKVGNEYSPELRLRYAGLQVASGETDLGKEMARRAAADFKKATLRDQENVAMRIRWANSEALRNNEQQVIDILTDGFQKTKNRVFLQELARYFVQRALMIPKEEEQAFGKRLDYIQRALTVDSRNPSALRWLAVLATSEEGKDSEAAQKDLLDALASGHATAVVHMIVGTAAIKEKNYEVAKLHLRQALALNNRMPDVLNNLAWVLSIQQPPETQQALELLDNAVKILPQEPEIRETRGQLHAKLKNWEAALTDLEYALIYLKGRAKLHETLADCYENLGDKAMAKVHRQKATDLKQVEADEQSDNTNDG